MLTNFKVVIIIIIIVIVIVIVISKPCHRILCSAATLLCCLCPLRCWSSP